MKTNNWAYILLLFIFFILIPSYLSVSYLTKTLSKTVSYNQEKEKQSEDDSTSIKLPSKKDKKVKDYTEQNLLIKKKISGVNKNYVQLQSFDHSMFMDSDKTYFVQWKINKTHITFDVQVKTLGWVGLGLSPNGGMANSDMAVMWVENGKLTLQDRFAEGHFLPPLDDQQDWTALYGYENGTHTIVGFSRLLDTCDIKRDRKITGDTVHLLYAYHSKDPPNGNLMQHEVRGQHNAVLTDVIIEFKEPQHEKKISFGTDGFEIPSENRTTYQCFLHQIKDIDKKYYMIAANTVISPGTLKIVHHILVHLCDANFFNPKKVNNILCFEDNHSGSIMRHCYSEILVIWAVGGDSILFPKDVGFPMDTDLNGRWVYVEVHYNNIDKDKGLIDNSVVDIYLTEKPVKHEAGQLFFGLFDFAWGLLIPPKQEEYTYTAVCSQHCMSNMEIPDGGMNVFLYFLHTHLAGHSLKIKIIRDGQELMPVMKDDNYDFNFQIYRTLPTPLKIMKGDTLILECTYSTMDRANYTTGGFQTFEEMCLAYIYYYPRNNFKICGNVPSYPGLVKGLAANVTMEKLGLIEMINFQRHPDSLEKRDIILKQMNTEEWQSEKGVKKLKTIYKNLEYDEICRYMSMPEIKSVKIPKYKPYKEKTIPCVKSSEEK